MWREVYTKPLTIGMRNIGDDRRVCPAHIKQVHHCWTLCLGGPLPSHRLPKLPGLGHTFMRYKKSNTATHSSSVLMSSIFFCISCCYSMSQIKSKFELSSSFFMIILKSRPEYVSALPHSNWQMWHLIPGLCSSGFHTLHWDRSGSCGVWNLHIWGDPTLSKGM